MPSQPGLIDQFSNTTLVQDHSAPVPPAVKPSSPAPPAAAPTPTPAPFADTGYQAATAAPAAAAPTTAGRPTFGTTTSDQTVEGRIKGIIDENGPLQQQAASDARQAANERGLINSSMAVTAGQSALYRAAMPIAQQDAATVAQQSRMNQDTANQSAAATAAETNQNARFNANATNAVDQSNTAALNQSRSQASQQLQAQVMARLDATTRTSLINLEANYRTLMQASDSAASLYQQTMGAISQLQNNTNLDANSRNMLIAQQTQLLQNGLALMGGINALNLTGLLDFSGVNNAAPAPPPAPSPPPPPSRSSDVGGSPGDAPGVGSGGGGTPGTGE